MDADKADLPRGEIVVYEAPNGEVRVDVRLDRETVWLSLTQMAELFGRDKPVISTHLRNVFQFDAILSVVYRVNSKRDTQFRVWATRTLRDRRLLSYTLNERRRAEREVREARPACHPVAMGESA